MCINGTLLCTIQCPCIGEGAPWNLGREIVTLHLPVKAGGQCGLLDELNSMAPHERTGKRNDWLNHVRLYVSSDPVTVDVYTGTHSMPPVSPPPLWLLSPVMGIMVVSAQCGACTQAAGCIV